MGERAATTFVLCIAGLDLVGLDDGVVVCPGLFETVGEQFDRRLAVARPCEKAERRSAEPTNRKNNFRHHSLIAPSVANLQATDCRMQSKRRVFDQTRRFLQGCRLALQSTHGFGTAGTGAGDRDAAGGENAGAGSGCSDGGESSCFLSPAEAGQG